MLKLFFNTAFKPDEYLEKVTAIDLNALRERGIKALLFDLDNTLLPPDEYQPSVPVVNWFSSLKEQGFYPLFIVNDLFKRRVQNIAENLKIDTYYFVCKPYTGILQRIIEKELSLKRSEVALIGDQLFFDILPGNLLDLYTILIRRCDSLKLSAAGLFKRAHSGLVEKYINK